MYLSFLTFVVSKVSQTVISDNLGRCQSRSHCLYKSVELDGLDPCVARSSTYNIWTTWLMVYNLKLLHLRTYPLGYICTGWKYWNFFSNYCFIKKNQSRCQYSSHRIFLFDLSQFFCFYIAVGHAGDDELLEYHFCFLANCPCTNWRDVKNRCKSWDTW